MEPTSTSKPGDTRLNPARIQLARERRGLSKVALARALGLTTRVLQTYETDGAPARRAPDLARVLDVEPHFFELPDAADVSAEQGFFRAPRRVTAGQLGAACAATSLGVELYDWIAERFTLPNVVMPDLDTQSPDSAASALRALWAQSEAALPNLVQLSEAHGVRVMSLPKDTDAVDAFSLWFDGVPYVFLSMSRSAERARFDLAHELGHLVMHARAGDAGHTLEREADAFAAALLMPERAVVAHAGREPAAPEIMRLRSHYRVSAMTMTSRLHQLGRLTDWGYRQNCGELARRGFRSAEPGGIQRETSRVFATVFPSLREQGITTGHVARALGITPVELHELTLGHAPIPLMGGGVPTPPLRPVLQVLGG